MYASGQLLSAIMLAVATGSFFWVYKVTSVSAFKHRNQDRRLYPRPHAHDRRNQKEPIDWSVTASWLRRIVWITVAIVMLMDFAGTFEPIIGLI